MKRLALMVLLWACAPMRTLPPLQVRTMQGAPVHLDQLRGPLLLDMWATWCKPCAVAMPFYEKLARETGLRVVAMSIDDDDEAVRRWIATHDQPFEILRDPNGDVAESLGMRLMPTSFLIDAQGRVVARYDGFRVEDEAQIERDVHGLLGR
jgi:thiol-disulfide isomerase/thioredoxin